MLEVDTTVNAEENSYNCGINYGCIEIAKLQDFHTESQSTGT